jgi:hypothetical protein
MILLCLKDNEDKSAVAVAVGKCVVGATTKEATTCRGCGRPRRRLLA